MGLASVQSGEALHLALGRAHGKAGVLYELGNADDTTARSNEAQRLSVEADPAG
jgi:hypothetical protein